MGLAPAPFNYARLKPDSNRLHLTEAAPAVRLRESAPCSVGRGKLAYIAEAVSNVTAQSAQSELIQEQPTSSLTSPLLHRARLQTEGDTRRRRAQ